MKDQKNPEKQNPNQLKVKVIESEKIIYSGVARSVSSDNPQGHFDVLPGHQSFISIIKGNISIETEDKQKVHFKIGRGILKCIKNEVEVLVGLESL